MDAAPPKPAFVRCDVGAARGTRLATRGLTMRYDDTIASTMFGLLRARAKGATICPSEVARALEPVDWRPLMPRVREVAVTLAAAGEVELRQRGRTIEPFSEIRGPLRIASSGARAARDA